MIILKWVLYNENDDESTWQQPAWLSSCWCWYQERSNSRESPRVIMMIIMRVKIRMRVRMMETSLDSVGLSMIRSINLDNLVLGVDSSWLEPLLIIILIIIMLLMITTVTLMLLMSIILKGYWWRTECNDIIILCHVKQVTRNAPTWFDLLHPAWLKNLRRGEPETHRFFNI